MIQFKTKFPLCKNDVFLLKSLFKLLLYNEKYTSKNMTIASEIMKKEKGSDSHVPIQRHAILIIWNEYFKILLV